jgi:hypothetical protein
MENGMTTLARYRMLMLIALALVSSLLGPRSIAAMQSEEVIVYETYGYYGGPADIHSVNPDGTNDVNLTPDTEDSMELDPEISPDGTRIVFISNRVIDSNLDGNFEIFTMAIDGSDVTQITVTKDPFGQFDVQSFNPTWSPDGLQIAFDGYLKRHWKPSEAAFHWLLSWLDEGSIRRASATSPSATGWSIISRGATVPSPTISQTRR